MNVARTLITSLLLIACLAMGGMARAQEAEESTSTDGSEYVEAGREAFGTRMPWYDAEKDDVRALDLPTEKSSEFGNRKSRWQATPAKPRGGANINVPTMGWFGTGLWTVLKVLFWLLVAAILIALVYMLVKAYLQREEAAVAATSRSSQLDDSEDESERIESLPFTMARPRGDLLDEAMAHYKGGNFRQAIIYLYSYLLIQLDKHQQIHLARGKTNRMYLRELRQRPQLQGILERTMFAFEDVFFGNHTITREEVDHCLSQLDEFHQHVEQVTA